MIAFDEGFRKEWFLQKEKIAKANDACHVACGMSLHEAWTIRSGCYVGGVWISPLTISRGIAKIVFGYQVVRTLEDEE